MQRRSDGSAGGHFGTFHAVNQPDCKVLSYNLTPLFISGAVNRQRPFFYPDDKYAMCSLSLSNRVNDSDQINGAALSDHEACEPHAHTPLRLKNFEHSFRRTTKHRPFSDHDNRSLHQVRMLRHSLDQGTVAEFGISQI